MNVVRLEPNKIALRERDYSLEEKQEIILHVIGEIAAGRPVSRILREDDGMPSASAFWRWHFENVDIQDKVARAREHGVEAILEEARDIADQDELDWHWEEDDNGKRKLKIHGEAIQRSKLRVETRFKAAQMIAPRKYGPRVDVTSGGERLAPSPQHIDARVQSIVMRAAGRMAAGKTIEDMSGLDEEALKLLE